MGAPQPFRDQPFDTRSQEFIARVSEQLLGLSIDDDDVSVAIDNDNRVRGGFKEAAKESLFLRAICCRETGLMGYAAGDRFVRIIRHQLTSLTFKSLC